jgi:hypothetical protein
LVKIVELLMFEKCQNQLNILLKRSRKRPNFLSSRISEALLTIFLCCASLPETPKKLMLTKVDHFAKAVEICLEEEKAAKTSRQFVSGSSADVAATSTYKKDQKAGQTAAQGQSFRGHSHNRGGYHCG